MLYRFEDYRSAADFLAARLGDFRPEIAVQLGSGLDALGDQVEAPIVVPYGEIPGFHTPTAPGHRGRLIFGMLEGRRVAVMQGRFHAYEGYSQEETGFPIRVLKLLGCSAVILTNAAGGVNLSFRPGDICLLTDHIRLSTDNPLWGANLDEFGPRFPDTTHLYTPALQDLARRAAVQLNLQLQEGVYMYMAGPSFETPAEIRAIRVLGADVVGMSTVAEAITAGHAGMQVLAFSLVTNAAAGVTGEALTHEEVLAAGKEAAVRFTALLRGCIREME